ncbi:hypothetical protein [Lacinutrix algicola]|uniref:hypothetical protein n=1 Tax=Lacinutrix algicola TaxID=342954 RepID=UPI0006E3A341|nr:hypothetical protein [Lacinutrix algicola]
MLRRALQVLFVLISYQVFACTCIYPPIPQRFDNASVVFKAKIVEVVAYHENTKQPKQPKQVRFNLLEDFKGTVSSDFIYLSKSLGSCSTPNLQVGSTWLIFSDASKNERIAVSICNPSVLYYKGKVEIEEATKLKVLKKVFKYYSDLDNITLLKSNNTFSIYNPVKGRRYKLSYKSFNNDYGLYYITVDPICGKVIEVTIIKTLNEKDDLKIIETYKSKRIKNRQQFTEIYKRRPSRNC